MATINWRIGSADIWVFVPVEAEGGAPVPTDGLAMQLRVAVGAECRVLQAVMRADGAEVDLAGLGLTPGNYKASEWWASDGVYRHVADRLICVTGGC